MLRLLLRVALWLTAALVVPVVAARALPHPDSTLPGFLASDDCVAPCFLGIRPGQTTLAEAVDLLRAHQWVDSVEIETYDMDVRGLHASGWVSWRWSDSRPDVIDGAYPGRLNFNLAFGWGVVESVYFHTSIRPYDLQRWFGVPGSSVAAVNNGETVSYLLVYPTHAIKTVLDCPATLMAYWNSRAEIVLRYEQQGDTTVAIPDVVRMC